MIAFAVLFSGLVSFILGFVGGQIFGEYRILRELASGEQDARAEFQEAQWDVQRGWKP